MTEDQPLRNDGGTPNWVTYVILSAITFSSSMVCGWINRVETRTKHEQLLGKIEEVQKSVRTMGERNKR